MKIKTGVILTMIVVLLSGCGVMIGGTGAEYDILDDHAFIDDVGNKITINDNFDRIISLSATHTENLYSLDAYEKLIGVNNKSNFPVDVINLQRFDLSNDYDVDAIIASHPDLVLIEPSINSNYPKVVAKLESEGLFIVSLMADSPDEFEGYIKKLAMITDSKEKAEVLLMNYYSELEEIRTSCRAISEKQNVFIQSTEKGYYTAGKETLLYQAFEIVGANNIADDKISKNIGQQEVYVGFKNLLKQFDKIDVYCIMTNGGSIESMLQQERFSHFSAVINNRLYELADPLVNQYTFRYVDGVRDLSRLMYPELVVFDLEADNEPLTRIEMAKLLFDYFNLQVFTITDSDYYDFEKFHHCYGCFEDVSYLDNDFNIIETVVMKSYLSPIKDEDGTEWFNRNQLVTKAEFAKFIYILMDISSANSAVNIVDVESYENETIIRKVVESGWMTTENGYFYPEKPITKNDCLKLFKKLNSN